jgi:hypothetical protein
LKEFGGSEGGMKRRGMLLGCLIGALIAGSVPAQGGAAGGVCTVTITFSFNSPISNNSPVTAFTPSGSGTCVASAQPLSPVKHLDFFGGNASGSTTHCNQLFLFGSYGVTFSPDPAPASSFGTFNFWGTASGGFLLMLGSQPTFLGPGVLAGGGLLTCTTQGSIQNVTFTGVLAFVDP